MKVLLALIASIIMSGTIFTLVMHAYFQSEINAKEYKQLNKIITELPEIVPYIKHYLEDGKISKQEFNHIKEKDILTVEKIQLQKRM